MSSYIANKYYSTSYIKDEAIIEDPSEEKIDYTKTSVLWGNKYFQFHVISSGEIYWIKHEDADPVTISYRKNGGAWNEITSGSGDAIEVVVGDIVEFKGNLKACNTYPNVVTWPDNGYNSNMADDEDCVDRLSYSNQFNCSKNCKFNVCGNPISLINGSNFNSSSKTDWAKASNSYAYYGLFYGCKGVVSAENMVVLDANGASHAKMFMNCTNLKIGPYISCYSHFFCFAEMFANCTKLETIPYMYVMHDTISSLTAWTKVYTYYEFNRMFLNCVNLKNIKVEGYFNANYFSCYEMFRNCRSLEETPFDYIYAWSGRYACARMFYDCVNLKTTPKIYGYNGTSSVHGYYTHEQMFYNCSSIKKVVINASSCGENFSFCFRGCFTNCSSLNKIICGVALYTTIFDSAAFSNLSPTGTYVGTKGGTGSQINIPANWTFIDLNGKNFIDLDLPSGTLWAPSASVKCAWGETATKETFTEENYSPPSKYENQTTIDPEDDAVAVNWGGNWELPTEEQIFELNLYTKIRAFELSGWISIKPTVPSDSELTFNGSWPTDGSNVVKDEGLRIWTKTKNRSAFIPSASGGSSSEGYSGQNTLPITVRYTPGHRGINAWGVITIPEEQ